MSLMMPVCCCSVAQSCPTFCNPMDCSRLGFLVLHHLPEFAKTRVRWFRNAIQPSDFLSSILLLPWVFPSIRVFSNKLGLFQWVGCSHHVAKVLELQLQHQSFQWIFRTDFPWMDWLDLLTVQGTLKSLLQHHSLKASVLWLSAFFIVQLSHLYMTAGKTIALTIRIFVGKLMSLPFNTLSLSQLFFQGVSVF